MSTNLSWQTWVVTGLVAIVVGAGIGWFPLWVLLILILAAGFYFFGQDPKRLVAAALVATVLGQVGRIPPGSTSGDVLVLDVLVVLLSAVGVLYLFIQKKRLMLSPAHLAWLAFLLVGAAGFLLTPLALSKRQLVVDGFYLVRLFAYSSLVWLVPHLFPTENERKKLFRWILTAGLWVVGLGYLQMFFLPNIGVLAAYGWDPHVGRFVSTFLDPNYLGGYLAILLSLLLVYLSYTKKKEGWVLAVLAVLVAGVLTYSRSGYLAVALVVFIFGLSYSWKLMLAIALVCLPLALSVPRVRSRVAGGFQIDKTSQDRINSWKRALTITDAYPVTGAGYNHYKAAQEQLNILEGGRNSRASNASDSSLLSVLATTGLVGVSLFLLSAALLVRESWLASREEEKSVRKVVGQALLVMAPALAVHSQFVNALFFPFIMLTLVLLIGLLYSRHR